MMWLAIFSAALIGGFGGTFAAMVFINWAFK